MTRIDEQAIADTLLNAPGWARVGLCAPTVRMREEAARELARAVMEAEGDTRADRNQEQLLL